MIAVTYYKEGAFLVIMVMGIFASLQAEELCIPGGRQIFPWHYDSDATRLETNWFWDTTNIMTKTASGTVYVIGGTPFSDRIWEYNETNCGLIIDGVRMNDTGTFKVDVDLQGPNDFHAEEMMSVTDTGISQEILSDTEIWINGTIQHDPKNTYLGPPPLLFTVDLTLVCIQAPIIKFISGKTVVKQCDNNYTCTESFLKAMEITVNITVGTNEILYQPGGMPFTIGENTTSSPDPSVKEPCRERINCIVPATVVPIGCVVIASGIALIITKTGTKR